MKQIIINYLNDSISKDDLEQLKTWLQQPKNQEKFKDFVRLNHQLNELNGDIDAQKAFENITNLIKGKPRPGSMRFTNFLKYAAILIGISIIGYGVLKQPSNTVQLPNAPKITLQLEDGSIQIVNEKQNTLITDSSGKKITEQRNHQLIYTGDTAISQTLRYNILKVPNGKTFGLILSDGSKVTLNAGSELRYPVQFIENQTNRTVFLNGEAYFEVAKNADHPFIVDTQDMDVEVLGTHFNVTSYVQDDKTYTVLVEGKVAAYNKLSDTDSKILSPNEKVFFNGNLLETETVNVQKYVAWVYGELVFVDDSFKVIQNKLERKYNITINNSYPALDDIMITATFKNESINQVLKTFQTYKPFDYTINGSVVTITKPKSK
ncbi:MAG: FecR family protein [Gelidibacter sp.]